MKILTKTPRSLVVCVIFLLLCSSLGYAGAAQPAGNITVAPALLQLSISKRNPHLEESISIKNNFATSVELTAQLGGIDQESTHFTPNDKPDPALAQAVHISTTNFTLLPGQSINLKLSIDDLATMTPGNHYGSLLIKQVASSAGGIGLQPAVSVTMFIIKEDGAIRSLALEKTAVPRYNFGLPNKVTLTFKNEGNVRITPKAAVIITSGQTEYAKGVANEDSLPISLSKPLKLEVSLAELKTSWLPKKYTRHIIYRYEGQDTQTDITQNFWVFPPIFLIGFASLITLLLVYRQKVRKALRRMLLIVQRSIKKLSSVRPK